MLIAVGFFVAFSVKLGLFPFHFWLPTVYTGARPAVAAILSGGLANIGAYGLLRFGGELLPDELDLAAGALIVIGGASIVYGGMLAISRRSASEMLAYSAIGQVGYVLVAIGVGGPVGFAAAILYTVVNALNKTLLFLTAQMRGAIVGAAFAIGALSVAGVPPAAGFVGKLELFRAAADDPEPASRCSSSAARSRSSTPSRSTSTTSGAASGRVARARCRSRAGRRPRAARPRHGRVARAAAGVEPRRRRAPGRRRPVTRTSCAPRSSPRSTCSC